MKTGFNASVKGIGPWQPARQGPKIFSVSEFSPRQMAILSDNLVGS